MAVVLCTSIIVNAGKIVARDIAINGLVYVRTLLKAPLDVAAVVVAHTSPAYVESLATLRRVLTWGKTFVVCARVLVRAVSVRMRERAHECACVVCMCMLC